MGKWFSAVLFAGSVVLLLSWMGVRGYNAITFNQDISGHLKRAADANTIELATKEMETALGSIEQRGLTSGYTSILYKTPDEDINFWYSNLSDSLSELKTVNPNASQLEKSNVLMKLRETLLDSGEKSTSITCPSGISVYPYNTAFCIWGWLSLIVFCISWFWLLYEWDLLW